ncbi:hypothetical protein PVT68_07595 [Microbulbifer bruguierae]|uniref:Alkyl hydroperoxide reductase subunit C/ Thiol specific antioxidant domain-containing protein n=1 Tax=Microbulbifer bruguierae TaxID=3029061 RepID=A0ABY8NGU5_9GAMM|nr:hypothetical protein [Microbulbifer bruguierae]WGL18151.1 hypothetical protein PVT68_07595 [Microbulbifer bruguierae]
MNKFKVFFTFLAFIWLLGCGFWSIYSFLLHPESRWIGLLINAWALPFWMLLRYQFSGRIEGDLREPGAFAGVLGGLAIVLLTDVDRGMAIYLAIYNLFVLLIYLYHLSAVHHPKMPRVDATFPTLCRVDQRKWQAAEYCRQRQLNGVVLIFLRGSYCADSRNQLLQLCGLQREMARLKIGLLLWSVQSANQWPQRLWPAKSGSKSEPEDLMPPLQQLAPADGSNATFVAHFGAPLLLRPWIRDAARPSAWLIDAEGFVVWRQLASNYRTPVDAATLRSQLFRLQGLAEE